MATGTEGSTLIAHVVGSEKFTDEQLQKILMITDKRYASYKEGSKETPRAITETLFSLAEYVGFPEGSMTPEDAAKVKPYTTIRYNGQDVRVLAVSKTGVMAPYFSLLGKDGIHTGVPYRLTSVSPNGKKK